MITLKDYLEAVNYRITGGSEYQWRCFGDNARYLDCADGEGYGGRYSITAIFDSADQTVYCIELWDYENNREYRWTHPEYIKAYATACEQHGSDRYESCDGRSYIDLDVAGDILEKITAIVAGEEYDTRVQVEVNFSEEDLFEYMKLAHKMDITFNELAERAIKEAIKEFELDPEGFKQRAKNFINEDTTSQ